MGWLQRATAVLALIALGGCAGGPGDAGTDPAPHVLERPDEAPLYLAAWSGTVAVEDGCVVLVGEDDVRLVPLFPPGSARWRDGRLEHEGEAYPPGAPVELVGGLVPEEDPGVYGGVAVPEACADLPLFSVS